jgi:hypothetical protein
MKRMLMLLSTAAAVAGGCTEANQTFERPEDRHVFSRVDRGAEGDIVVAAAFSGGAAGDVTLRLLACPVNETRCEQLAAVVGAHPEQVPEVSAAHGGIVLTVNREDRIGFFRSFSRVMPSLSEGQIHLRYRD